MDQAEAKQQMIDRWKKASAYLAEQAERISKVEKADEFAEVYVETMDHVQDAMRRSYELYRAARPKR